MKKILYMLLMVMLITAFTACELEKESGSKSYSESESNDTPSSADSLSFGKTYEAEITYDDFDWYYFVPDPGTRYEVTAEWVSGSSLDLDIEWYAYVDGSLSFLGETDENLSGEDETGYWLDYDWDEPVYIAIFDYFEQYTGEYTVKVESTSSSGAEQPAELTSLKKVPGPDAF